MNGRRSKEPAVRGPYDRPRRRRRTTGMMVFAVAPAFLLASCTSSGDGQREAQPPASTTTTMPTAETARFDIATQPGGAVADGEGVWVIEGSGAVRVTNDGNRAHQAGPVVADGRPVGAAGPMATSDDGGVVRRVIDGPRR